MTKKKIGLLSLALVLALGALGVGYAMWTDTITIHGTVNTGSVDINVDYYSGTYIYKDLTTDNLTTYHWLTDTEGNIKWSSGTPYDPGDTNQFLVASAATSSTLDESQQVVDDEIDITFCNAFPTSCLWADCIFHYNGSVPAHVTADIDVDNAVDDAMLVWLYENGFIHIWGCKVDVTDILEGEGDPPAEEDIWELTFTGPITEPLQMHYCDYIKVWLSVDLPQVDDETMIAAGYTQEDFMSKTWHFTAHVYATQWNES
jgi:hypothetical protein